MPSRGLVHTPLVQRRGTVYIAPVEPVPADGSMIDPETARFWASWQDEDADGPLDDADLVGAEAAITWGRERSPVVLIRLGNRGDTYLSAGEEHVIDDEDDPIPLWPPKRPPHGGWWDPKTGHSGSIDLGGSSVWLDEDSP